MPGAPSRDPVRDSPNVERLSITRRQPDSTWLWVIDKFANAQSRAEVGEQAPGKGFRAPCVLR